MQIQPSSMTPVGQDAALRKAAEQLEAGFIAEMLKSAGIGKTPDAFGGGAGEDQFSSFMLEQQAMRLAEVGGFGLAESIFHAMKERSDDR